MERKQRNGMSFKDHLVVSAYWFATNFHWGALLLILLPGDIAKLANDNKALVLGNVTGLAAIPAIIVPLIAGALSDRCRSRLGRRKPFLAVGVAVNIVGLLGMAWAVTQAHSLIAYFWSFAIVQIGNNIASGAYMGVIPDVVPESDRGKASGFMAIMSQIGTLAGAVICGQILASAQTVERYAFICSVLALVAIVSFFGIKEQPQTEAKPFVFSEYLQSLWISPREHPNFAWVWFTRFLVMLGFYAIMPFVNYYLVDVVKIPQSEVDGKAPILLGIILIVSSISGIVGGMLSDKIGRRKIVYFANGLIAVIAPAFAFCTNFSAALLVGAIFGLGYGAYISVDYALGTDVLPNAEDSGKDMAVWHIAMTLPQTLAAPLAGRLIAAFGVMRISAEEVHYTQMGYASIFILCSVSFALGAFFLRNLKGIR